MKKLMIALFCGAVSLSATAGGNIANGEALVKKYNCASCHGADFTKSTDPSYPKLAGQHAEYLKHALIAYKRGEGPNGRNNAIMGGFAKPLSNKEIDDIAAYLHSLPSGLVLQR
ncbi:cytochrome c [Massilia violaceinigra]|uniref:Cytochrome c n=1 Tax=Massilia violaceinigra TaxID=2045208 RepID=A0ABY4A9B3_9BURK|nr:cytochrome c [Massilia violaceinigra]UOD31367.1 cytochrome c [Massilia violaceinigra]